MYRAISIEAAGTIGEGGTGEPRNQIPKTGGVLFVYVFPFSVFSHCFSSFFFPWTNCTSNGGVPLVSPVKPTTPAPKRRPPRHEDHLVGRKRGLVKLSFQNTEGMNRARDLGASPRRSLDSFSRGDGFRGGDSMPQGKSGGGLEGPPKEFGGTHFFGS